MEKDVADDVDNDDYDYDDDDDDDDDDDENTASIQEKRFGTTVSNH